MRLQALIFVLALSACRVPQAEPQTVVVVYTAQDAGKAQTLIARVSAYPSYAILDPGPEPLAFTPAFNQRLLWCLRADVVLTVSPMSPLSRALRAQGRIPRETIF